MDRKDEQAMHRIADAYQAGSAMLATDANAGAEMVEQALVDAYQMGACNQAGDPDVPPERFMAHWELWQAWQFGMAVNVFGPLDAPVCVISSRETFAKRDRSEALRMAACPWPPRTGGSALILELVRDAALSHHECF